MNNKSARVHLAKAAGWRVELTFNRQIEPQHTEHELVAPNEDKYHFCNVSEADVWNYAFDEAHIIPDWFDNKSAALDYLEHIADDNDWRIIIVTGKYVALEAFAYTYGKWQEVAAVYYEDDMNTTQAIAQLVLRLSLTKSQLAYHEEMTMHEKQEDVLIKSLVLTGLMPDLAEPAGEEKPKTAAEIVRSRKAKRNTAQSLRDELRKFEQREKSR